MTSSNLVDCTDRQVGGLFALEDASGIDADLTISIRNVRSVAHQPAGLNIITLGKNRRNGMACRCDGKLHAPGVEKRVGANEDGIGALTHKTFKGSIDLAKGAGMEDLDLDPKGGSSRLYIFHRGLGGGRVGRIDENSHTCRSRHHFAQQPEPLCSQLGNEKIDTRRVAPRLGEAGDQTKPDGVVANAKDDRDRRGRSLCGA